MDNTSLVIIIVVILIIVIGFVWYNNRNQVEGLETAKPGNVSAVPPTKEQIEDAALENSYLPDEEPYSDFADSSYTTPTKRFVLYLFYSPQCNASQEFLPVWKNVLERIRNSRFVDLVTVNVDDQSNRKLTFHYGIEKVPTIVFTGNRGTIQYTGPRSPQKIIDFVKTLVQQSLGTSVEPGY